MVKALRGTRDILPGEAEVWQYIECTTHRLMRNFGFREIRFPIFEETSLFVRSIGETTDIVEKEMYTFTDRKGRSITLRPEGTASVVRAFLEHQMYVRFPLTKLYYLGPMFRYERPQAGRQRQFHQIGAEILGTQNPSSDVEIISLAILLSEELGLQGLKVELNSVGCPNCRSTYREKLRAFLRANLSLLCSDCRSRLERNPLRVLDCKRCRVYTKGMPLMPDYLCDSCLRHFEQVQSYLKKIEIQYSLNPYLVRGLDYYTKTAFEVYGEELGAQNAVAGGGRYDGLVEEMGGPPIPGVGFSLGMERLVLALEKGRIKLPFSPGIDIYMAFLGEKAYHSAFELAYALRRRGLSVESGYGERSLKSQLRAAGKVKAKYVVMVGEEEISRGRAMVKNMETGEQREIALDDLVGELVSKFDKEKSSLPCSLFKRGL